MKFPTRLFPVVAFLLLAGTAARAENWPGFRGPTGQGISVEKSLPTSWAPDKNVAWKTPIPGEAWSSPIVWNDRVFLTTATDEGTSCRFVCISRADGKILWNVEVFKQPTLRKEGRNSYATPTPVTDGENVYSFFGGGGAAAVDFNGKVVWTNTDNKFYSQHGLGASPILYKDLLIMPWDPSIESGPDLKIGWQIPWDKSYIWALDKRTGKERYKAMRGMSRIAHMTPRIIDVDGSPQLVSAAGDTIGGFEPETGKRIWWVYSGGEGVTPSPVFGKGMVYSSSGFPTGVGDKPIYAAIRAFRLGGKGESTEENLVWEQRKGVPTIPSLLLVDDLLYSLKESGIMQLLSAADGSVIYTQRLEGSYSASPIYADGHVYLVDDQGNTTVLAHGREFKELSHNPLNESTQASPAFSQGDIFIRTHENLYCIRDQGK